MNDDMKKIEIENDIYVAGERKGWKQKKCDPKSYNN